ncbi:related to erv1 protein, mitochondrial precursor [Phialocephala subalpina]|uniref:Sulfhydryl oxidase n=1 Tax=Phialocephala subalpina TaxID=576137 RepID=A0A1L7WXW9_9HELO|nr:related to erv1 protein, mitochondrial precursor [Phialocephala subalpina]
MADDTREQDRREAGVATGAGDVLPKKLRQGIILGKDGKPCRSCNSFADFKAAKSSITTTSSPNTLTSSLASQSPPPDCPPDVETLGRSSWTLLHSITATYPTQPTPAQQQDVKQFLGLFGKIYPCWTCAEDFQVWMKENRVRTESREEFGRWMCEAHNGVNRKLGKREFDCNRWEERWRTGWKDGSCD